MYYAKLFSMTLATHIVIAGAIAKPLMGFNPIFTFCAALASHYLSDAIPHWDYDLESLEERDSAEKQRWNFSRRSLAGDLAHAALDGLLGSTFLFIIFPPTSLDIFYWIVVVVMGAVLPDFLQGLYFFRRPAWMRPIHNFHSLMHAKIKLGLYHLIGIPFQFVIFLLAIYFLI